MVAHGSRAGEGACFRVEGCGEIGAFAIEVRQRDSGESRQGGAAEIVMAMVLAEAVSVVDPQAEMAGIFAGADGAVGVERRQVRSQRRDPGGKDDRYCEPSKQIHKNLLWDTGEALLSRRSMNAAGLPCLPPARKKEAADGARNSVGFRAKVLPIRHRGCPRCGSAPVS